MTPTTVVRPLEIRESSVSVADTGRETSRGPQPERSDVELAAMRDPGWVLAARREAASISLTAVAPDRATGPSSDGPISMTNDDLLARLALWLAEVAVEAALAATVPEASSTPGHVPARRPGVGEPAR